MSWLFPDRFRVFASVPDGGHVAQNFAESLRRRMGQEASVTVAPGGVEPTRRAMQTSDEHEKAVDELRRLLREVTE